MHTDATSISAVKDRAQDRSFSYDAFLSYDHDDRAVAYGIQRGLHRIGRRVGKLYALRVFRDSTDLTASPDLWGKVTEAMDRSRYLIVVLSPHAAASNWVNSEVAHWLASIFRATVRVGCSACWPACGVDCAGGHDRSAGVARGRAFQGRWVLGSGGG